MSSERKTGQVREKELRLAISRIQRGRSTANEPKLTIAAVAREVGVSTALIHNCHPDIAEMIREAQGRSRRAQLDAKHQALKDEQEKVKRLREEVEVLRAKVAKLATLNEVLLSENRDLKSQWVSRKVVQLSSKRGGNG